MFQFSAWNTEAVTIFGAAETYKVHKSHGDKEAAAQLMKDINDRNQTLFIHLREKYLAEPAASGPDPDKSGRIDIVPLSKFYEDLTNVSSQEYMQERIQQLINNYSPARMYEISPRNSGDATSYTEDKRTLILCLRNKKPNANGVYALHDINTMMFVVLHELTHMANKYWQHNIDFWQLFKFFLNNSVEAGIYDPVDYGKYPLNYCGLDITYNPYFDPNV